MPVIQFDPLWLLAPAFVIGGVIGYRRGWRAEAFTAGGLALAIALLWRGPDLVVNAINGVLSRLARVIILIVGGDPRGPAPQLRVSPELQPVVTVGLLVALVVLAYIAGSRLGRRFGGGSNSRWYGAIIGALNLFVVMSRLLGTLLQGGPTPPGANGLNIRIPAFPGATIVVPPPSEGALLVNWPLAAIVFLLVSMLVFALVRMARA